MKITIETLQEPQTERELAEILNSIGWQIIAGDINEKEQMDGSYRVETPAGIVILSTETNQ
jgi:hypothetical protein